MDVTPLISSDQQIIQSYGANGFKVSGVQYKQSIIIMTESVIAWNSTKTADKLTVDDFKVLTAEMLDNMDVILLGCGEQAVFPSHELKAYFKVHGVNLEFMDTGAACRTYNVLMAEGRRVATALLTV